MARSTISRATGPFTESELAVLRGLLEQQRAFRIDQLSQLDRVNPPGPLSSSEDAEVAFSLANGARAALRDVQLALWRMDDGHYGRCTDCGGWLEKQRLAILPQIATCLGCRPRG
jgi:RNA polymerase-binding transcription factor DksA